MIARIAAVLVLITVIVGGIWYFFRDTPAKKVSRWRDLVQNYLEEDRLEDAEFWQDEILKYSGSDQDKMVRAEIGMRKGTRAGIKEAVAMYDIVLASEDPRGQVAALHRARAMRALGHYYQAYNSCLSVMDRFPLQATMFMAETANAALNPSLAVNYYTRALKYADRQNLHSRARVHRGLADSFLLLRRMNSTKPDIAGLEEKEAKLQLERHERRLEKYKTRAAEELNSAVVLLASSDPTETAQAQSTAVLLANLFLKLGNVRGEGETPCYTGSVRVEEFVRSHRRLLGDLSPELLVRIGALHLRTAHEERGDLKDTNEAAVALHNEKAEKNFLQALDGLSPDAARSLLEGPFDTTTDPAILQRPGRGPFGKRQVGSTDIDRRRRYVQAFASIVNVYLRVGMPQAILEEDAFLGIRRRLIDTQAVEETSVRRLFTILEGFALLSVGQVDIAKEAFDGYISGVPENERAVMIFRVAERIHDILPDSSVPLDYLNRFEETVGNAFERIGPRVNLLTKIRARTDLTNTNRASALLAGISQHLREEATSPQEHLIVSHVLEKIVDAAASMAWLETAHEKFGSNEQIHRALLSARSRHAHDLVESGETAEAIEFYRRSLGALFALYVRDPSADDEVRQVIVGTIRALDTLGGSLETEDPLREEYSTTPVSTRAKITRSLPHLFRGDGRAVLDELDELEETDETAAFLSFARGKSILISSTPANRSEAFAAAKKQFTRFPRFPANRIELFALALAETPPSEDVDDALFTDLHEFASESDSGSVAKWLLSEALQRRVQAEYRDENRKNSEVAYTMSRLQSTLRKLIRDKPTFTRSYLAFAKSFTTGELDRTVRKQRELFRVDYGRAIALLRGVPIQDEKVLLQLAHYLQRAISSNPDDQEEEQRTEYLREAVELLEVVTLLQPTQSHYQSLLGVYIDLGDFDAAELVFGDLDKQRTPLPPSDQAFGESIVKGIEVIGGIPSLRVSYFRRLLNTTRVGDGAPARHRAFLGVLRRRLDQTDHSEGIRHLFLAHILEAQKANALPRQAEKLHADMISHYEKSLAAYEAESAEAPITVLNNLAWYLAESTEAPRRQRGLEIASMAVERVPDHREAPTVHDTFAWALYRNGRFTEAEVRLKNVLKHADTPTYRYHLAQVLVSLQRYDEAIRSLRQAFESPLPFPEEADARRLETHVHTRRSKTRMTPRTVGAQRR